jgi:hypothetical protein
LSALRAAVPSVADSADAALVVSVMWHIPRSGGVTGRGEMRAGIPDVQCRTEGAIGPRRVALEGEKRPWSPS